MKGHVSTQAMGKKEAAHYTLMNYIESSSVMQVAKILVSFPHT
jgi:hypothetical protein